jgi:uncharacterized protein
MSEIDLPDVNVLVALVHRGHVHHQPAQEWFADVVRFATTPITEAGLMGIALNRTVMGHSVHGAEAVATLRSLRAHDRSTFLPDDSSLADARIDLAGLVGSRQVTDLHLVNLAALHGARLVTFDTTIAPVLSPDDQRVVLTLA